jgi:hypothetical protein
MTKKEKKQQAVQIKGNDKRHDTKKKKQKLHSMPVYRSMAQCIPTPTQWKRQNRRLGRVQDEKVLLSADSHQVK